MRNARARSYSEKKSEKMHRWRTLTKTYGVFWNKPATIAGERIRALFRAREKRKKRANFLLAVRAKIRLSFMSTTTTTTAASAVVVCGGRRSRVASHTRRLKESESGFISCFELPLPSPRSGGQVANVNYYLLDEVCCARAPASSSSACVCVCMRKRAKPIIYVGFWVDC